MDRTNTTYRDWYREVVRLLAARGVKVRNVWHRHIWYRYHTYDTPEEAAKLLAA